MAMRRLIACQSHQGAPQSIHKLFVAGSQNAKRRNHQIPRVRLRISPPSSAGQSFIRSACVVEQDLKSRLFGLFNGTE